MKAIILEDEDLAVRRLKRMLEENYPGLEVTATFDTVRDLAQYLLDHPDPDILFLDIHVADGSSFELFDIVVPEAAVVFVTAYDEYAVKAFRMNAIDYLMKPVKAEELKNAVDKARKFSREELKTIKPADYKTRYLIKFGNKLHIVEAGDIAYIFSENKLSYFVTFDGQRIPSDFKLKDLEDELNPEHFFRANRQIIVSLKSIKTILTYSKSRLKLKLDPPYDGDLIVSTERTRVFKQWLGDDQD